MKRFVTFLAIFLWSFGAAGAAQASLGVLCLGADGHVAKEFALNNACADGLLKYQSGPSQTLSADHCGPCVDISMASPSSALPEGFAFKALFSAAVLPPMDMAQVALPMRGEQAWIAMADPPLPSAYLLHRKSVQLLV